MTESNDNSPAKNLIAQISSDLLNDDISHILYVIESSLPVDIANLLESLPPSERKNLWELIPKELEAEILRFMRDEARNSIIQKMPTDELVEVAATLPNNEAASVFEKLPETMLESVFDALDKDHKNRIETVLSYQEGTAGRLMSSDVISIREDVTLSVVQRWLRKHKNIPRYTDALMVVDHNNIYQGQLLFRDILINDGNEVVKNVMSTYGYTIPDKMSYKEIASLFEKRDLISVAVLDENHHLLGKITIDDALQVIREQSDAIILKSEGLKAEEDLFSPVLPSVKGRGVWLGINLATVFLAAWVIGLFSDVLDQIVALAILMPIVASMGGIAGSQTLTLTIRGLALDQIAQSNIRWLTIKELSVGVFNGLIWSIVVALVAYLWFRQPGIAAILGVAMLINLIAASISGVLIPIILDKLGIDPALSGAVILTTVTDIIGFLSFLGLATWFLL